MQPDPRPPQGAFTTDNEGMEGIDPPVDRTVVDAAAAGYATLQVDRIDPTAQSLGAAMMQSEHAIANVDPPNTAHTAGVAPDGRVDRVS